MLFFYQECELRTIKKEAIILQGKSLTLRNTFSVFAPSQTLDTHRVSITKIYFVVIRLQKKNSNIFKISDTKSTGLYRSVIERSIKEKNRLDSERVVNDLGILKFSPPSTPWALRDSGLPHFEDNRVYMPLTGGYRLIQSEISIFPRME